MVVRTGLTLPMANAFDPYREMLVVETNTIWPAEYAAMSPRDKAVLEAKLHASPSGQ